QVLTWIFKRATDRIAARISRSPTEHETSPLKLAREHSLNVEDQTQRRPMAGKRAQCLAQLARIPNRATARITKAVSIGSHVDDRFGKNQACWRRWKCRIIVIIAASNADEAGIEQLILDRIVVRKLLGIVQATDAPGKSIMQIGRASCRERT